MAGSFGTPVRTHGYIRVMTRAVGLKAGRRSEPAVDHDDWEPYSFETGRGPGADAILDAACRLIARDGVLDLSLRELIAEAGSSNRAFYRHFPSKDAFLMALVESLFRQSVVELSSRVESADLPAVKITEWINTVLDRSSSPTRARLGRPFVVHGARLSEQFPDVYASIGNDMIALVQSAIEDGVRSGDLTSRSPRRDAHLIFDLTMAVTNSHVLARRSLGDAERAAVVTFSLRALGVDPKHHLPGLISTP